jgi:dTDP-glucose 4,6-dehydratase
MLTSDLAGPLNIGNPDERSVLDIARDVVAATESRSTITFVARPPDDPSVRCPDITRARELLGWQPAVSWAEGLDRTITWVRAGAINQSLSGAPQEE